MEIDLQVKFVKIPTPHPTKIIHIGVCWRGEELAQIWKVKCILQECHSKRALLVEYVNTSAQLTRLI